MPGRKRNGARQKRRVGFALDGVPARPAAGTSKQPPQPSERLPARKRAATNVREQNGNGLQNINGLPPPHKK